MGANRIAAADCEAVSEALELVRATAGDWETVQRWAADEGWNPGVGDARIFMGTEPNGFRAGHLDGRLASAISVVRYADSYAHIGYHLVAPDLLGQGLGTATFTSAMAFARGRTIGLDAVPNRIDFYASRGFEPAWRAIRYQGPPAPHPRTSPNVVPFQPQDLKQMSALDAAVFPAPRYRFAINFAIAPGRHTLVATEKGIVRGYGVLRPAHDGMRIGPVYADAELTAAAVLGTLCDRARELKAPTITVDVPDNNPAAMALAEACGLHHAAETTRMYHPDLHAAQAPASKASHTCFALTSLELG